MFNMEGKMRFLRHKELQNTGALATEKGLRNVIPS